MQAYTLGTTSGGKVIEAKMQSNRCLYRIQFQSGGQLPRELEGEFTNVGEAQQVVDFYLDAESKKSGKRKAA